jgi:hypothetical protein
MNEDSRFAYFRLPNGTTFHLPRSVLDLAAAPARLQVDSLITLEALAAAILGVPDVDFLKWGDSLSEASNELESKMARSQAPVLGVPYGDSEIDRIMEAVSGIEGDCRVEITYDTRGNQWQLTVDNKVNDPMSRSHALFGGAAVSLTEAVNSLLRSLASHIEWGVVVTRGAQRVCTPVAPPSVGEIYGVPLLSRVYAVRPSPMLGRLCYAVAHGAAPAMRFFHCDQDERSRVSAKAEVLDDYGYAIPVSDRSQIRLALCCQCREPQFWTPSGFTCKNGHGGADALPYEETPS